MFKKIIDIVAIGVIVVGSIGYCSEPQGIYQCKVTGPGISNDLGKVKFSDNNWDMTFQEKWVVKYMKESAKKGDNITYSIIKKEELYILNMKGTDNTGQYGSKNLMIFTYNKDKDILNVSEMGAQPASIPDRKIFTTCLKVSN